MNAPSTPAEETGLSHAAAEGNRRLHDAVVARLSGSGYSPLRTLAVEVSEGVVVLRGVVPSFYLKQLAQTLVLSLQGVRQVGNRIEVRRAGTPR